MRVSHCTVLIVMFVVLCVFVFPACVKNTSKPLTFYLVVAQALVLTFLEQMLYEQGEGFYSTLLVVMTSAVGCLLSLRLYECDRLELQAASVLLASKFTYDFSLCSSKLTLFFSLCFQNFCSILGICSHGIWMFIHNIHRAGAHVPGVEIGRTIEPFYLLVILCWIWCDTVYYSTLCPKVGTASIH